MKKIIVTRCLPYELVQKFAVLAPSTEEAKDFISGRSAVGNLPAPFYDDLHQGDGADFETDQVAEFPALEDNSILRLHRENAAEDMFKLLSELNEKFGPDVAADQPISGADAVDFLSAFMPKVAKVLASIPDRQPVEVSLAASDQEA